MLRYTRKNKCLTLLPLSVVTLLALLCMPACNLLRTLGSGSQIADGPPLFPKDISGLPEPVPVHEPLSARGNPPLYTALGKRYRVWKHSKGYKQRGLASWYGTKWVGRPTSSGAPYDLYQFTAAHRHLPLPTYARVTNLENGKSVVVRINDRGPFHGNRIIDLSYAAAAKLGMVKQGTAHVEVTALEPSTPHAIQPQRAPRILKTDNPQAGFRLQLGVFSSKEKAHEFLQRLQKQYPSQSFQITATQAASKAAPKAKSAAHFRVETTLVPSRQHAEMLQASLHPTPSVIQYG